MTLEILYRDARYVAVDKPAGMLVHRSALAGRDERPALQRLRDQLGRRVYPVHRLDRPTSGVLIFALDPEAARALAERFAARAVDKRYLAVVRGWLEGHVVVEHALRDLADERPRGAGVGLEELPRREATTAFTGLARARVPVPDGRYSERRYGLVLARPRTGRRHQIRRHLKHRSHPIIGDVRYGKGEHNRFFRARYGCARLLLAAVSLRLEHPFTGAPLVIDAPISGEFRELAERFGWGEAARGALAS